VNFLKQLSNPDYASYTALLTENNSYTYQELNRLTDACASIFLNNNLSLNSTLLLCFQNQSLQFIASIAALKLGACHLSLQPGGSVIKKIQLAEQTRAQVLVTDFKLPLNLKTIDMQLDALKPLAYKEPATSKKFPAISSDVTSPNSFSPNALALIVPGSGTTGIAKLIGIDYKNFDKLIARDLLARPIKEKECHLSFTPVEFYTAKRRNFATLQAGGCVIIREAFNTPLYDFLEKYTVHHISLASSHAKEIVQNDSNITKKVFSKTKTVFLGGSPISEKLRKLLRDNVCENLFIAYGTNEMGECCIANPQLQKEFENCVGRPLKGVELEIVDANNQLLPANTIGFLRIKNDGAYSCYLNPNSDQKNTPAPIWFYPGDYALINDQGVLILKGRSDDAITYNGTMIYPREIEQVLEAIPEVNDVAAFALDQPDNQIPAVVFTASRQLNIKNVDAYLKRNLGWLSPQYVQQINHMPKNDAGKILKREIKQTLMAEILKKTN